MTHASSSPPPKPRRVPTPVPPVLVGATRLLRSLFKAAVLSGAAEFEDAPKYAWLMDRKLRFLSGTFSRLAQDLVALHKFKPQRVFGMETLVDAAKENVIVVLTGDESTGVAGAHPRFTQARGPVFDRLVARQLQLFDPTLNVYVMLVRHVPGKVVMSELFRVDGMHDARTPAVHPSARYIFPPVVLNKVKPKASAAAKTPAAKRPTKIAKITPKK